MVCQSYGKETIAPKFADLSMVAVSVYFKSSVDCLISFPFTVYPHM